MRRFELVFLVISAAGACVVPAVFGWLELALAAFDCFYAEPIGGAKRSQMPYDPFWVGFWDALGLLGIPWMLTLIFFAADNHRRAQ